MEKKFTWKAEIKFVGSEEDFNAFVETVEKLPVEFSVPEWRFRRRHFAGCMPVPIEILLGEERLSRLAEGMPQMKLQYIRDICGGIRTPHFHLKDRVVLLDRTRFKEFAAQVAHELAGKRAEQIDDYIDVMQPVGLVNPASEPAALIRGIE